MILLTKGESFVDNYLLVFVVVESACKELNIAYRFAVISALVQDNYSPFVTKHWHSLDMEIYF